MTKQDDGLFLLEVLVDKIVFVKSPCFSDKDFRTCVNIECLSVEPLEICDDEPGACIAKSNGPYIKSFNNGKSCLFSLKESDIAGAMSKFPIKVTVYKSLPCGCLPTKIIMGECTIDMTKEFVEARKTFLEDPTCVSYQALKDSFHIVGPDGTETGEIVMFLRISCFGSMIITRFQGPGGPPNIGAGKSSMIVDRSCNPRKDFQSMQDPCVCGAARGLGGGTGTGGGQPCNHGGGGVCPAARDPYNSMPCQDPDDPCYCSGPKPPPKQQMACRNTDQYCLHVPKDCCPTGNKVVFQLPSDTCEQGHKQRAHFKFTSDGVGDLAREEPGQFKPISAEDYPGVVYDFPKQVIKMRIGRTIEMPGRKSKLEYQFITPVFTQDKVVPVKDTSTAQCVNTCSGCCVRRCTLPRLPYYQELTNEQKINIKTRRSLKTNISKTSSYLLRNSDVNCWKIINRHYQLPLKLYTDKYILSDTISNTTTNSEECEKLYNSFYNRADNVKESYISAKRLATRNTRMYATGIYGSKVTPVYMTLSDKFSRRQSSGTQATASINKCFQVCNKWAKKAPSTSVTSSDYHSTCTMSTVSYTPNHRRIPENVRYPRVYFFGRKKEEKNPKGMGPRGSRTRLQKTSQTSSTAIKSDGSKSTLRTPSNTNVTNPSTNTVTQPKTTLPPKPSKTAATSAGTSKTVSIKEDKSQKPCPSTGVSKGDMAVTVSHIKIGPKETCPVHGNEPCQGPKCVLAASGAEQGPVKITSINNPRRGVFEVVVRRLTGAPLAKNELMLEWTPPPSRAPPCGVPCPTTCFPPSPYRSSKCKLIVCRPSPCRPKCSTKKRCVRAPCGPMPCRRCGKTSCCGKSCKPCPPPRCTPCSRCVSRCRRPCSPPPCGKPPCNPCKSSPCLRPCPIGYKRPRRYRSQPRIKCHRIRISPCSNSSKACQVVKCRSVAGPCIACCTVPPFCLLPRKCCSVLPCKPSKCISSCSSCCG